MQWQSVNPVISGSSVAAVSPTTITSMLGGATFAVTYSAVLSDGTIGYSAPASICIGGVMSDPSPFGNRDGRWTGFSLQATTYWTAVPNATSYFFEISLNSDFSGVNSGYKVKYAGSNNNYARYQRES